MLESDEATILPYSTPARVAPVGAAPMGGALCATTHGAEPATGPADSEATCEFYSQRREAV